MKEEVLQQKKIHEWLDSHEKNVIYEIIFTTLVENSPNAAAMGIIITSDLEVTIRPFTTTQTYWGLSQTNEGIINVVTDIRPFVATALKRNIIGFKLEFGKWLNEPILTEPIENVWINNNKMNYLPYFFKPDEKRICFIPTDSAIVGCSKTAFSNRFGFKFNYLPNKCGTVIENKLNAGALSSCEVTP